MGGVGGGKVVSQYHTEVRQLRTRGNWLVQDWQKKKPIWNNREQRKERKKKKFV